MAPLTRAKCSMVGREDTPLNDAAYKGLLSTILEFIAAGADLVNPPLRTSPARNSHCLTQLVLVEPTSPLLLQLRTRQCRSRGEYRRNVIQHCLFKSICGRIQCAICASPFPSETVGSEFTMEIGLNFGHNKIFSCTMLLMNFHLIR